MKKNILLSIEYIGTNYNGFQIQPNQKTIQEELEKAIFKLTKTHVRLSFASRTDSGVHALDQKVNFLIEKSLPLSAYVNGLNTYLPQDIRVKDARFVKNDFNINSKAKTKIYHYYILESETQTCIFQDYAWHIRNKLNIVEMKKTLKILVGTHDFTSFKACDKFDKENESNIRTIKKVSIKEKKFLFFKKGRLICFSIEGTGFLKYMVRNIVGTIIKVGLNKITSLEFKKILEKKDRRLAGITAPPQGLFLYKITI
jgi:tRNA pseudouridine38-40 synthase